MKDGIMCIGARDVQDCPYKGYGDADMQAIKKCRIVDLCYTSLCRKENAEPPKEARP